VVTDERPHTACGLVMRPTPGAKPGAILEWSKIGRDLGLVITEVRHHADVRIITGRELDDLKSEIVSLKEELCSVHRQARSLRTALKKQRGGGHDDH